MRDSREFVKAKDMLQDLTETIQLENTLRVETHMSAQIAYHEMADVPVRSVDIIEQLENNIASLDQLRSRYSFVMREIRYLMKM